MSFSLILLLAASPHEEGRRGLPVWKGPYGMEFVLVPAGSFIMGSSRDETNRNDDERPHRVTISRPFYIMTTEVTAAQWRAVMGQDPSAFKSCGPRCPVNNVSWYDVQTFIRRLNDREGRNAFSLPTEAQWEYACRAGSHTAVYTGHLRILGYFNAPSLDRISWYGGNSCVSYNGAVDCSSWHEKQSACRSCGPQPVGGKAPNAWGIYDMIGNVWEWVNDWYGPYPTDPVVDPSGPASGTGKVLRGCSWNYAPRSCRAAYRLDNGPRNRLPYVGFRLVRTAD